MCWITHAITPRCAWAETKLGEWYWDTVPKRNPWWAIAWLEPDEPDDYLYAALKAETARNRQGPVNGPESCAKVKPQRAPNRNGTLSTLW